MIRSNMRMSQIGTILFTINEIPRQMLSIINFSYHNRYVHKISRKREGKETMISRFIASDTFIDLRIEAKILRES